MKNVPLASGNLQANSELGGHISLHRQPPNAPWQRGPWPRDPAEKCLRWTSSKHQEPPPVSHRWLSSLFS